MYAEDSFFTLTPLGQVGLFCLSSLLCLVMLALTWLVARGHWALRLAIAFLLFWGFVVASPQVYFQYYHLLFEGLPNQWVIYPRGLEEISALLTFSGPGTLSAHSQGALGWTMAALALFRHRRFRRNAAN